MKNSKQHQIMQYYYMTDYKSEYMQDRHAVPSNQLFRITAQFHHHCHDADVQNDKITLEHYDKLLEKRPFFVWGHCHEAVLLYETKKYQSLGSLEKACKINPNIPIVNKNYHRMKQEPSNSINLNLNNR